MRNSLLHFHKRCILNVYSPNSIYKMQNHFQCWWILNTNSICPKFLPPLTNSMLCTMYHTKKPISSLMYMALGMCLVIVFAVSYSSQFMQNPGRSHWGSCKEDLKGNKDHILKSRGMGTPRLLLLRYPRLYIYPISTSILTLLSSYFYLDIHSQSTVVIQ